MQNTIAAGARKATSPLRYAVGMFGTSIPINMFKTYAAFFYIDKLGLITTQQFSLVLFLYTFVDAIDNPVYGFLSDRTRTRWGRRRLWLMLGAPLLVLCFILFFNPPASLAAGSAFSYMLLMYILTGTLDSLINANYGALFPELFRTEAERAKTNAMRQVFQLIAMVVSIALTPMVTDAIGFSATAILYGVLAVAVIWFMSLGCHEDPAAMERPKPRLFRSLFDILKNPKFWIYGITNASLFCSAWPGAVRRAVLCEIPSWRGRCKLNDPARHSDCYGDCFYSCLGADRQKDDAYAGLEAGAPGQLNQRDPAVFYQYPYFIRNRRCGGRLWHGRRVYDNGYCGRPNSR